MKNKLWSIEDFKGCIKDGMSIMVPSFASCGIPHKLIAAIVESGVKNLTIIACDSTHPGEGTSLLVANHQVSRMICGHIGMNPETGKQMISGEIDIELVPLGTLTERIRAAGAGLGGILTQTGLGTDVQDGKQIITINGEDYILELPIKADLAILKGSIVDKYGNIVYKGTTNAFNQVMATAADLVVVEAEELVEVGEIAPMNVMTQAIFVDHIIA